MLNEKECSKLEQLVQKHCTKVPREITLLFFQTEIATAIHAEFKDKHGRKRAFDITDYNSW